MAIAFDAVTVPAGGFTSWTHTCTGSNRMIWVVSKGACSGVTYNSVSLTLAGSLAMGGSLAGVSPMQLWYLFNPASGANTVALTGATLSGVSTSFTGTQQSGSLDGVTTNVSASSVTSLTTSLTTTVDNDWLIIAESCYIFGAAPLGGTGMTLRGNATALGSPALFDSNGAKTPAGSHSGQTTLPFGNEPIYHIMAAFKPTAPAASATTQTIILVG